MHFYKVHNQANITLYCLGIHIYGRKLEDDKFLQDWEMQMKEGGGAHRSLVMNDLGFFNLLLWKIE